MRSVYLNGAFVPENEAKISIFDRGFMFADGIYEVTVTATVTTTVSDKTLFLVEAKQAGIFEIRNIPEDQLQPIIGIACPQIIYPYLRAIVSDVCTRAGFPPVVLAEVNFQAMFEAQQQQQAAANGATATIN